ncbi:MAG: hypothetical protein R6U88_04270 [Candidatus Bipolaricaulota bacterium]
MRRCALVCLGVVLAAGCSGWGQVFGLPALDPELSFWTLETEHFRIHFHQGLEGVSQEVAVLAEDAYETLQEEFGGAPDKLDIMLVDPFDFANGFANPFFDQIGVFSFQGRLSDWSNVRLESWWEMVVFHEVVHAIDLDRTEGISEDARQFLGKVVLPNMWKPWAFVEGLSVYMKYKHLGESRLNDARTRAMIRQLVLDGEIPELDELRQFYDRAEWPAGNLLIYNFSAWFMLYIEETHGDDALRRINDANAGRLENLFGPGAMTDFDVVVREALDVGLDKLYAEFREWLRGEFIPEIEALEEAGVTHGLRLTSFGWHTEAPAWSPNGDWIAYTHRGTARRGLRIVRPDGEGERELVSGDISHPAWTPDGQSLVYARLDHHGPYYILSDLYLYELAEGRERRLTSGERAYFARVSPDGRYVYYACALGRDGSTALRRLDLVSWEKTTVAEFPGAAVHSFALCPNGQRIALSLLRRGGYQDLYLGDATAGGEFVPLTQDRNEVADPVWSADGEHIFFASDPGRISNVYAYSTDEEAFYQVTRTMSFAGAPTVDPEGEYVALVGYGSEGYDVYRLRLEADSWQEVSFTWEEVPQWLGYPEADYPVRPYRALEHLVPAFWLPVPVTGGLGVALAGQDPLGKHSYFGMVGWNWEAGLPALEMSYTIRERFPVELELSAGRWGSRAGFTLSLPVELGATLERWADLGFSLGRAPGKPAEHTLSLGLRQGAYERNDLAARQEAVSLRGALTMRERERERSLDLSLKQSLRLPVEEPHWLAVALEAGWTDSVRPEAQPQLGGTEGRFALRGFPRGVLSGPQALRAGVSYEFSLLSIEWNLGHRPLFFDDLRGRLILEAGTAGDSLPREGGAVSLAVEATLSAVVSYNLPLSLTVGVAQGVGEPRPVLYFSVSPEMPN